MTTQIPAPTTSDKCQSFAATHTELGNGRSIAILAAPCNGIVTARAVFENFRGNAHPPSRASLAGKINGVILPPKTDHDFDNTTLTLDPVSVAVNSGSVVTFETERGNKQATERSFVMTLSFTPS
jgi:hypothetical protein